MEYLKDIGDGSIGKETPDCAVYSIKNSTENFKQISTCDFFYPLINDPFNQGKIAVANVLSDIYSMGVSHIDNVLMILGVSMGMDSTEAEVVTREMIKGFNESCMEAETKVTGGQSVINPWPMIGGTAISTIKEEEIIYPYNIKPNDDLILTKPLGTQIVSNLVQWKDENNENYQSALKLNLKDKDIMEMLSIAVQSMSRLNKNGAKLMRKYKSHGATDITGFGFLGHATNLVEVQKSNVEFVFHTLPLIKNTDLINKSVFDYGLLEGYSAETSGGLLLALDPKASNDFLNEMNSLKEDAWIVGKVKLSDTKRATILSDAKLLYI